VAQARTVQLGQFVDENADLIGGRLTAAGIQHWGKRSGGLTRWLSAADWGTRIFVEEARLDEAKRIVSEFVGE